MWDKLKYSGGPLIPNAHVQLIFWGSDWSSTSEPQAASDLTTQLTQLLAGPYMRGLSQYSVYPAKLVSSPTFDPGTDPPPTITTSVIGQYLQSVIGTNGILDFRNDDQLLYLVVTQNSSWEKPDDGGFHFFDQLDGKTFHWAWISTDSSAFASHEIIEACTNPEASGWLQPENANEAADICLDTSANKFDEGVLAATYWSNVDGSCILPRHVARIKVADASGDRCVGPHVGGFTRFTVSVVLEPAWIDQTGLALDNPKYTWTFDSAVAAPVGATSGSSIELRWLAPATLQKIGVTVTTDNGVVLAAKVTIQNVLDDKETAMVERMCVLRKLIETTALLPPPLPDPEGPIIATVLPTPAEIGRLRSMIAQMGQIVEQIGKISVQRRPATDRAISAEVS